MDHYEISSLINSFKNKENFDEFITFWLLNQVNMNGFSTIFTFDEVGTELPVEPLIGQYDAEKFFVRSVFSRKNVYFLNSDIWLEMMRSGTKIIPVDCVLSFDTQFGNYALKFIKDRNFRKTDLGSSFGKLLEYIYANNINPEFSFYLQENYANFISGHEKEIKNQLYALVKIVDLDKDVFLETGEVKLTYGADKLNQRVEGILKSYKDSDVIKSYDESEYLQSMIATLILKAALLKKSKLDCSDKVRKLALFCDEKISALLNRELYVLSLWLMGAEIDFFDPINGGDKLHSLPNRIHGMAWDFMLVRHVEKYCVSA
jgi:hypothetical protein